MKEVPSPKRPGITGKDLINFLDESDCGRLSRFQHIHKALSQMPKQCVESPQRGFSMAYSTILKTVLASRRGSWERNHSGTLHLEFDATVYLQLALS